MKNIADIFETFFNVNESFQMYAFKKGYYFILKQIFYYFISTQMLNPSRKGVGLRNVLKDFLDRK